MGLFDLLLGSNKENDDDLHKKMEWNKFSEEEKELVEKGDYDIYNMEDSCDDDLDEDDYYYDK